MKRVARFDFKGRLDGITRTPQGGIRATANLTRTGIFEYQNDDGSPFFELRTPEEVFDAKALSSFHDAPLTLGHPGEVTAENWKDLSVGHVAQDVRANGKFVTATIVIQDAATCAKVESGELREISCGYDVDLEMTVGDHEEGRYDAIQRNIRGNHVALGGTDWGRAGRDVRIMLDAKGACTCGRPSLDGMATPLVSEKRIDAPANTPSAPRTDTTDASEGLRRDLDVSRSDNDRLRAERDAAAKRADTAEAERDAAKKEVADAKAKTDADVASFDAKVEARVQLVSDAKSILDEKDKAYDFKGKSDKDIRIAALKKIDATFDATGKTDGYIEARFDLAVPAAKKDQAALAEVNQTTTTPNLAPPTHTLQTNDANMSELDKARQDMLDRHTNAWKPKSAAKA